MLESLDLVKPELPAKPKRLWTKKIWKRNEDRGLRTRVFRRSADQTDSRPIERPAKSLRSINTTARWKAYKEKLAAAAAFAPGAIGSIENNKPRFAGQFVGENGLPSCPKCASDSEACAVQQGCVTRPSYRCTNAACAHEWRINLCGRCSLCFAEGCEENYLPHIGFLLHGDLLGNRLHWRSLIGARSNWLAGTSAWRRRRGYLRDDVSCRWRQRWQRWQRCRWRWRKQRWRFILLLGLDPRRSSVLLRLHLAEPLLLSHY